MSIILADHHHECLFESLQCVFVDRFGWKLYRPIGMEWFAEGYWDFGRETFGDALAKQFLAQWNEDEDCGDHWERADAVHPGRVYQMVTLEQARSRQWDFVLCSASENEVGLHRFAQEVHARWVVHVGNEGQYVRWELDPLAIVTTNGEIPCPDRAVVVRQEFSLDTFRYLPPLRRDLIGSFVQCFPALPGYALFREFATDMMDFEWRVYGHYASIPRDEFAAGAIDTTPGVAEAMREAAFIWHMKPADGFGHVIHNAFAVGRPVIGSMASYQGKMAGPLWIDGVTCIDLDRRTRLEAEELLRAIRDDPERHHAMCEAAAARFREVVDYEADADRIRRLLE